MTGLWVAAGFILAMCIAVPAVWWLRDRQQEAAWRREDDQLAVAARGRHRAPKPRPAAVTLRADRAIEPAVTEHEPPWEPAPAAVIEPAAVTQGPPPSISHGDWVLTAVRTADGQVTEWRAAVLPPLDLPAEPAMPGWVADILGHDTTDASVESAYTRALALEVRELTDGAS